MYFAIGVPNTLLQVLEVDENIIDLQLSGKYLNVLTNKNIFVWSAEKVPVLLGRTNLRRKVNFKAMICSPDSKYIATLDEKGTLNQFTLTQTEILYQLQSKNKQPIKSVNEKKKLVFIEQILNSHQGKATTIASHGNHIILTSHNCTFYLLNWNFDILFECSLFDLFQPLEKLNEEDSLENNEKLKVFDQDFETYEKSLLNEFTVKQIQCCNQYIGFVFRNGKVGIIPLKKQEFQRVESVIDINIHYLQEILSTHSKKGEWLIQVGGTTISFSTQHNLIAIGHTSGEVSIFQRTEGELDPLFYPKPANNHPYPVKQEKIESFEILRIFSLIHWGITPENTGKVCKLQWSPDGNVLAVGWKDRGISIWSVYGCRLMCSIPQLEGCKDKFFNSDQFDSDDNLPSSNKLELFRSGVKTLCWGIEGYSLFISDRQLTDDKLKHPPTPQSLFQLAFLKSSLAIKSPNLFYSKRLILQGSDRLYILEKRRKDIDNIQWSQLPLSTEYIQDNWPIKLVSVNRNGTEVAIAGSRGITLFDANTKNWKIFHDRKHEQSIDCVAMCWYRQYIIIVNQLADGNCELLAFHCTNLSFNAILMRHPIDTQRKPIMIDCNDQHLIYYTNDSFFYHYSITEVITSNRVSQLKLQLLHQTSYNDGDILSFLILPPNIIPSLTKFTNPLEISTYHSSHSNHHNSRQNHNSPLYYVTLNDKGKLSLLAMGENTDIHLSSNIEQFWFGGNITINHPFQNVDFQLSNSLWAYGEGGLQVWFPFFQKSNSPPFDVTPPNSSQNHLPNLNNNSSNNHNVNRDHNNIAQNNNHINNTQNNKSIEKQSSNDQKETSMQLINDKSLEFDLEVYPVGFIDDLGIVVGLSQGISYTTSKYPHFDIKTKTHPFLHSILRHLINKGQVEYALNIAKKHSFIPHFTHSLEFLLHEAVENATAQPHSSAKPFSENLHKVIDFLKQFKEYPQVVVSCVRKTDPRLWPMILKFAGTPKALFEQCLVEPYSFLSAASFLRVIYLIDGVDQARKLGFVLLEQLLNHNEISLLPDLLRFLEPNPLTHPSSLSSSPSPISPSFSPSLKNTFHLDDEKYKKEILFSKFVRKLLSQRDFYLLAVFEKKIARDLRNWLLREHNDSALLTSIDQFYQTFLSFHNQFHIPFPSSIPSIPPAAELLEKIATPSLTPLSTSSTTTPSSSPPPSPPSSPRKISHQSSPYSTPRAHPNNNNNTYHVNAKHANSPIKVNLYYPQPLEEEDSLYFTQYATSVPVAPISPQTKLSPRPSPPTQNLVQKFPQNFDQITVQPNSTIFPPSPYLPSPLKTPSKNKPPPVIRKSSNGVTFISSDTCWVSNIPPATSETLEHMLVEMYYSQCFDIVLVLSCICMNLNLLLEVLSENRDRYSILCDCLLKLPGTGYKELHNLITKYFSPKKQNQ